MNQMYFVYFIVAFLGGISVVISRILNAMLAKRLGVFEATFYNFLTGLILSILIFTGMFLIGKSPLVGANFTGFPFYFYLGGLFGLALTALSNIFMPKLSTLYFTLFMFTGQLISSMILDYIIYKDFSIGKLIGCILVVVGLGMNLQVDKKDAEKAQTN